MICTFANRASQCIGQNFLASLQRFLHLFRVVIVGLHNGCLPGAWLSGNVQCLQVLLGLSKFSMPPLLLEGSGPSLIHCFCQNLCSFRPFLTFFLHYLSKELG